MDRGQVQNLAQPISTNEIMRAITTLQSGKSKFYKKFAPLFSAVLSDMHNEALSLGRLPLTLTNATITLLLKKGKDPLLCDSFRPI